MMVPTNGVFVEFLRWCITALLLVTATASVAQAQEVASSLDQLRVLVKPEDKVTVTDSAGHMVKGTIAALSSASLELVIGGERRTFVDSDIRTIRRRQPDSLKNGAVWGFGLAAAVGGFWLGTDDGFKGSPDAFPLPAYMLGFGAIGTGVGMIADAMIHGNKVIYSKPAGSSPKLTLSPLLARDRKALRLSIGF